MTTKKEMMVFLKWCAIGLLAILFFDFMMSPSEQVMAKDGSTLEQRRETRAQAKALKEIAEAVAKVPPDAICYMTAKHVEQDMDKVIWNGGTHNWRVQVLRGAAEKLDSCIAR